MQLIIITGSSGSGKSIALSTLEDAGYHCIDNLPFYLLQTFIDDIISNQKPRQEKTAIGIDARNNPQQLSKIPSLLKRLNDIDISRNIIFLDANKDILLKRYSETRRRHPLTSETMSLSDAITLEGRLLEPLHQMADIKIDTSGLNLHQLRHSINRLLDTQQNQLSITVQSFGFKHGTPTDSDFIFDARCLPNPYWHKELRAFNGKDPQIQDFLSSQDCVNDYIRDISNFLKNWLSSFQKEGRSYLTIGIGCTGGHHRSVYIVEQLAIILSDKHNILTIHRNLE